jgi:hypothetical protein
MSSTASAAEQFIAGRLEVIKDTSTNGCGGELGEHEFFIYRTTDGVKPDGMFISTTGADVYIESADDGGQFFRDGTKGKMTGTVIFSTTGNANVALQTMKAASYTLDVDTTDSQMWKISKMTAKFTLKNSGTVCNFQWNGVATPSAYVPPT